MGFFFVFFSTNERNKGFFLPSLVFFASKTKFHLGIDQFKIHKSQNLNFGNKIMHFIHSFFLSFVYTPFLLPPPSPVYNPFNNIQKSKLISGISVTLVYVLGILVVKFLFQICQGRVTVVSWQVSGALSKSFGNKGLKLTQC